MNCNHTPVGSPVKTNGVVDGDCAKPVQKYRQREKWGNKVEFILSCIAFSVGLGNVWRFPYLCYKNGGGAFLIPYVVCLVTGGIPVFFMEIALGQYTSQGGISVWNSICPLFKGIGYGTTVIVFLLNLYYIIILSWALLFLYYSFTTELPWASCDHEWNTENCWSLAKNNKTSDALQNTTANASFIVGAQNLVDNVTSTVLPTIASHPKKVDAAVEFWENRVLQISSGIDEPGYVVWELALSLLVAWILCYFCIWKGVKSTGKAVYFTAIFPYVMLTVLLIRGVTLPGAWKGISFYLRPDFSRLADGQVWIDAGTQIFFSYAIALGCMTALGSYNDFHNDFYHQCIFIACCNSGTSLYSGFAIFSVLGFMAYEQGVDVQDVAESGPGLAFIAYPKAVSQMPLAPMWAVLFFIMIVLLGLGSQFVAIEGFITSVVDTIPHILRKGYRREYFIGLTCFVSYLIGLSMVTQGGMYVLQLFDYYAASGMTLLWFCFFESIVIAWIYGVDRFYDNISEMLKFKINPWLGLCWKYFTPTITMSIFLFSLITYKPLRYNQVYEYPTWSLVIGWCLALMSMVCIPVYFFYKLLTTEGTLPQRWKALITPNLPIRIATTEPVEMSPIKEKPIANGDKSIGV